MIHSSFVVQFDYKHLMLNCCHKTHLENFETDAKRAFALAEVAEQSECNRLPDFISKFSTLTLLKINLKSYLFKIYYVMTIHFLLRVFCARLFRFRRIMDDCLIIIIIIGTKFVVHACS